MRLCPRVPVLLSIALLGAPFLAAQTDELANPEDEEKVRTIAREPVRRATRSPFLPPDAQAAPTVTEDAPLQFCGFFGEGENMRYCLYDPARRRSVWLRAGDQDGPVQLQSFDAETRTVVVTQSGRTMNLKLQTAKLANGGGGGGSMASGVLPVAGAPANNPLVNTVVTNPTPADEAKRLEAVAAEVRRRRALRQAAAQNQGQPPAGMQAPRPNQ